MSGPIHVEALNTALTLINDSEKIKTYEDIESNLYKSDFYGNVLRNLSGLFLVVRRDYVGFIHRTAREFLLISNSANYQSNHRWKGSLNEEDAHDLMWNVCLTFLRLCPSDKLSEPEREFFCLLCS